MDLPCPRLRTASAVLCALALLLAACGSDPADGDADTTTGSTLPVLEESPDGSDPGPTVDAEPSPPSTTAETAAGGTAAPEFDVTAFDVTVTAAGSGGCVDSVQTASLDVLGGTGDAVWATFDLVLQNNCGDPGRVVVFGRGEADADANGDGWRRSSTSGAVSIDGPVCDERVDCTDGQRTVALDGPVDHEVGFELFRSIDDSGLIDGSPYEVSISALYDFATGRLDEAPIDIVVTVDVTEPAPIPSGDTTPRATGRSAVRVVGAGFDLLTFPVAAFADTPDALAELLAPSSEPIDPDTVVIDWARDAAVVFTIPTDLCPPVLSGLDVAEGVATPVFENPGYLGCEQPLLSHTVIAAVDRTLLAEVTELRLPPEEAYFDVAATASVDVTPGTDSTEPVPEPVDFGSLAGSAALPASGEAAVATLDDGAPVFIVRHRDGTVSALDPRAGEPLEAPPGIFGLAAWNAASRNFMARGVWDEYGRRVDGFRTTDMIGRATRVVDGSGGPTVEIGDVVDPPAGSPIAVSDASPAMTDAAVDLATSVTLAEALESDVGSTAVFDAAVVIDPTGSFVCAQDGDGFPLARCPEGSPRLDGGIAVEDSRSVYFGPLLATRTETGFTRVASTGGQAGESL